MLLKTKYTAKRIKNQRMRILDSTKLFYFIVYAREKEKRRGEAMTICQFISETFRSTIKQHK